MGTKTDPIIYNLKERGFKAFGNPRQFNIPLVASIINSPAVQEAVKARSIVGYLGHWPRVKWGAIAAEGGIDGKEAVAVEPAVVTTSIKAYGDGTIEHVQEFLETDPGQKALRMFQSKVGGFSSVINEVRRIFGGFDYVIAPNYNSNRGYTLDSAHAGSPMLALETLLDDAHGGFSLEQIDSFIRQEQGQAIEVLLDHAHHQRQHLLHSNDQLMAENEWLRDELARRAPEAVTQLDSAVVHGFQGRGVVIYDSAHGDAMAQRSNAFMNAALPALPHLTQEEGEGQGQGAPKPKFLQGVMNAATEHARNLFLG